MIAIWILLSLGLSPAHTYLLQGYVQCKDNLPASSNGRYDCGRHTNPYNPGTTCHLICNTGYHAIHGSTIHCSGGEFSGSPRCTNTKEKDCSTPTTLHGRYYCTSRSGYHYGAGDTCSLHCYHGYVSSGPLSSTTVKCGSDGKWSPSVSCHSPGTLSHHCHSPPIPPSAHSTYTCTRTTYTAGTSCTVRCSTGYHTAKGASSETITCDTTGEWSAQPYCNGTGTVHTTHCSSPPYTSHGSYHCTGLRNGRYYGTGSHCTVTCHTGYHTSTGSTHQTITCGSSGQWSAHPSCLVAQCPRPTTITYGSYRCTSHSSHYYAGTNCTLSCLHGWKTTSGASSQLMTCGTDGKWSANPTCHQPLCPRPTTSHGSYRCTRGYYVGSHCTVTCSHGYVTVKGSSNQTVTCGSNLKWSDQATCQKPVVCTTPTISHGSSKCSVSGTTQKVGAQCQVTCKTGYRTSTGGTTQTVTCGKDGKWSSTPVCLVQHCSTLSTSHGVYSCTSKSHTYGTQCTLTCNQGYITDTRSTAQTVSCGSTGQWSSHPSCHVQVCPKLTTAHGTYTCTSQSHTYGTQCTLTCDQGYVSGIGSQTQTVTCAVTGGWSAQPTCLERQCAPPKPPLPTSGTYSCSSHTYTVESNCTLTCSQGYATGTGAGSQLITCGVDGKWSSEPTCQVRQCAVFPATSSGTYSCTNPSGTPVIVGTECTLTCNQGYGTRTGVASQTVTCNENGFWSGQLLCEAVKCPSPPQPIAGDGNYTCTHNIFVTGVKCLFTCYHGYVTATGEETQTVQCQADGTWSGQPSCTDTHCGAPSQVPYGAYQCTADKYDPGTTCQLFCSSGYIVDGPDTITCNNTKQWVGSATCKEAECKAPPTMEYGHYVCPSDSNYVHGTTCHLECQDGYRPVSTNTNITCQPDEKWSSATSCTEGCPAGAYIDIINSGSTTLRSCIACPQGTYQENAGSATCEPCPPGWSTAQAGSTQSYDCKSLCNVGTFSSDGLQPCHLCAVGTYADHPGSTVCVTCPDGTTTVTVGASEAEQCVSQN